MIYAIYVLVDPRKPDEIRYVGQTSEPDARWRKHCNAKGRDLNTHRGKWIRRLRSDGVRPRMLIVEWVTADRKNAAERALIRRLKDEGHVLVNGTEGGEGGRLTGALQARASAKLSMLVRSGALKLPAMTPEQMAKRNLDASIRMAEPGGNPMHEPLVVAKNKATNAARLIAKGYVKQVRMIKGSPEHRHRMAEITARRDPSYKAKISTALAGKTKSDEHVDKIRDAYRSRSGLVWSGCAATLVEIARSVGYDRKTIRDHAKRHGITLQQAVDVFAKRQARTQSEGLCK